MAYGSSEWNCPYCRTKLSGHEIEYIQGGTSVACRGCGAFLSSHSFGSTDGALIDRPISPQPSYPPRYQPPRKKGNGALFFWVGFIVMSLGLYSWIFPIPIFELTYYGELFGAIAVVKGLFDLKKEAYNPSAIQFMIGGLALWVAGWFSWLVYIPFLSDFFVGELAGIGLIIIGYMKTK